MGAKFDGLLLWGNIGGKYTDTYEHEHQMKVHI